LECKFLCQDTNKDKIVSQINLDPTKVKIAMISEAPPKDHSQYFYQSISSSFFQTTKIAFGDAGIIINSYDDLIKRGVYLTTAIKCTKTNYLVSSQTVKECSKILETELDQFANCKIVMCMGDYAIKAINYIYKRKYKVAPIKSGSTYKIRNGEHIFKDIQFFPSYTQTGDSFNIEKSKRLMFAEDIKKAMKLIK
jgi:uracil-DNA glycosylase